MGEGIGVRVLGDYGPFSRMGKSIGYQVTVGQSSFLLDCGAPLFQQIGGYGLKAIKGLIITHCHDDHKRWFSDLALFYRYAPDIKRKVPLIAAEDVIEELYMASGPALDRSLSLDSRTVIDIPYEEYIEYRLIGPRAKFRIAKVDEGDGRSRLLVADLSGNPVGPERAKIVISSKTRRPRLLFKDPVYGEWVEPESFYPFTSEVFYEKNRNIYIDDEGPEGFIIEAIKSPVWHGIPGVGLKFKTSGETLIFSSDTAHDVELWKGLCSGKKTRRPGGMSKRKFEKASVIEGDINDYIERTWSRERYEEAVNAFGDSVVIHDIATRNSIVHTDYKKLPGTALRKDRAILTHGPDTLTSEWVLSQTEKQFRIRGKEFFEVVGDRLYPFNADIYHKEDGGYFVGYRSEEGNYRVYERDGLLYVSRDDMPEIGREIYRVDLYEDIKGGYYPKLEDRNAVYFERRDGRVELLVSGPGGSEGRIVENQRDRLTARPPALLKKAV